MPEVSAYESVREARAEDEIATEAVVIHRPEQLPTHPGSALEEVRPRE